MSLLKDIKRDLGDLLTQRAFDIDISDPTIPLHTKMGDWPHIFVVAGPDYVRMGLLRMRGDKLQVMDEHRFEDAVISDREKLLQAALEAPKWQGYMGKYKKNKRRFLLGYVPDKGDAFFWGPNVPIPVADLKAKGKPTPKLMEEEGENARPLNFTQKGEWIEYWLREHPTALFERIGREHQPNTYYGILPVEALKGYFIYPQASDDLDKFIRVFYPLGEILKVSLVPLNLVAAALQKGLYTGKESMGLLFIAVNGTLIGYGWSTQRGSRPILRIAGMQKGVNTSRLPKDSQLGKALASMVKSWMDSCRIKPDKIGEANVSFLHYEEDEVGEHSLSKVVHDTLAMKKNAIQSFHFHNLNNMVQLCKGEDPRSADITSLLVD